MRSVSRTRPARRRPADWYLCWPSSGAQLLDLLSILLWAFITSFGVWYGIKTTLGIRVDEEYEYEGVDISECGVEAYPEFSTTE